MKPPISELCHTFCPCQRVFKVRISPLFRPRKRAGRGIMSGKVRFWAWPVRRKPPPTIANPDRQTRNTPFHRFSHFTHFRRPGRYQKPPLSCPSPGLAVFFSRGGLSTRVHSGLRGYFRDRCDIRDQRAPTDKD